MKPIRNPQKHYIANAAKNTSQALAMAMHIWNSDGGTRNRNIPVLVKSINALAVALRNECNHAAYEAHKAEE
jgi:hypothetical protein